VAGRRHNETTSVDGQRAGTLAAFRVADVEHSGARGTAKRTRAGHSWSRCGGVVFGAGSPASGTGWVRSRGRRNTVTVLKQGGLRCRMLATFYGTRRPREAMPMQNRVAVYIRLDHRRPWPEGVLADFSDAMTPSSRFVFPEGSRSETQFLSMVELEQVQRLVYLRCSKSQIGRFPYYHLCLRARMIDPPAAFLQPGSACNLAMPPLCWTGAVQQRRVRVAPRDMSGLDIVRVDHCLSPMTIIISRQCKNVLEQAGVVGCRYVPCVNVSKPGMNLALDLPVSRSEIDDADYWQLQITQRVHRGTCVGRLRCLVEKCPRCGAVSRFLSTEMPGFYNEGDLVAADFQRSDSIRTYDDEEWRLKGEEVIVSQRVISLILQNELKGLTRFLAEPRIDFAAVDIRKGQTGHDQFW